MQTHTGTRITACTVYDGVYHTPLGRFSQGRLLDNQEGANRVKTGRYVFRKLSATYLPTRTFWAPTLWRNRKIGPGGCDICRRIHVINRASTRLTEHSLYTRNKSRVHTIHRTFFVPKGSPVSHSAVVSRIAVVSHGGALKNARTKRSTITPQRGRHVVPAIFLL